jgi:rhodanese-related sulfurtransferase
MSDRQTIDELLAEARARLDRLEPAAALTAQGEGAILIDLRCADQRRESRVIPDSVHVPLSVLYWRLDPTSGSRFDYARPEARIERRDGMNRPLACAAAAPLRAP